VGLFTVMEIIDDIMELQKPYTIEQWEKLGLLENIPIERKPQVVNALNVALEYLLEKEKDGDKEEFETLPFPVLIRITKEIDLTNDQVLEIVNDCRLKFKEYDFNKFNNFGMDYESFFTVEYADDKIKELQTDHGKNNRGGIP
jgi:hypothetical protein